MSFEVYIQCFENGAPSGIPRDQVRSAFGQFLTEIEPHFWKIHYDNENDCHVAIEIHEKNENLVHHLCIERPCGDKRLWESLAIILNLGTVVLYNPGGSSPSIASDSVVDHLPSDMVASLGTPICVQTGEEIVRHIVET